MTGRRSFLAGGACAAVCAAVRPFIARAADALPALPEYYAGYLPQVTARINALKQRTDDGFFFLTDLHIPANRKRSGQLIADLIGRTRLRNVYCGGDFPQAYGADPQANVDAPLTGGSVALADGAVVSFELETAENGMILVPRAALPVGGSVSVSVAVEGRFVATTRTALSGDVVAAVAGAPELAARRDAFAVAADGVTAVIANAVAGFWYSWEAADEPTGPFAPVGDPVRASLDGELEMSLAEPIRSRRFYRLRVSGKAH